MNNPLDKLILISDDERERILRFVPKIDNTLDLFLGDLCVSNVETVTELRQGMRDDTFYVLVDLKGTPQSVYYKHHHRDGNSYFSPICDFHLSGISDGEDGVTVDVDSSRLRVLSLNENGEISVEDIEYILSTIENALDRRMKWSKIDKRVVIVEGGGTDEPTSRPKWIRL